MIRSNVVGLGLSVLVLNGFALGQEFKTPRPEHPRPDAMRAHSGPISTVPGNFASTPRTRGSAEGWEKPDARRL